MSQFINKITRINLYLQIPEEDVISKHRFVLFRIFSFTGFLVCVGVFFKMHITISNHNILPYFILGLSAVLISNFYLVNSVRRLKRAYLLMLISAFLLLHLVSYSCGGIRTAGTMYFAVIILYSFMLLGNVAGRWFTGCIVVHLFFLYFISNYTGWTSFDFFNNDIQLINQDFLVNSVLSFLLIASQSSYLQSGKNVIIQRIEKSKNELIANNKMLFESNQQIQAYAENLEKSNKELDKFASVASHDLKAPLRAIGSLAGMIEEDAGPELNPEIRNHIHTIKGRVNRMEQLLNALLEYSRADRLKSNEHTIDTEQVVEELRLLLCLDKKIQFERSYKMPFIFADRRKFKHILTHLISNAIVHNDKEQILIELKCTENNMEWIFSLKDNGPGIDKSFHERVFVIFQTLNRRDSVETMGAGLAVAKKMVEDKNGRIWLESEPGKGSEFFFTIPKKATKV